MRSIASLECNLFEVLAEVETALMSDARIDLVCCIPAYHVLDRLVSAGVELDPGIHLEDTSLIDDNMLALCDQSLDIPAT